MNFDELLKRRGIDPEKVLVMRHVEKSPKTFRETLERWARVAAASAPSAPRRSAAAWPTP